MLDPRIRKAMGINLENSVVILDEAQNIDGNLRDSGSEILRNLKCARWSLGFQNMPTT